MERAQDTSGIESIITSTEGVCSMPSGEQERRMEKSDDLIKKAKEAAETGRRRPMRLLLASPSAGYPIRHRGKARQAGRNRLQFPFQPMPLSRRGEPVQSIPSGYLRPSLTGHSRMSTMAAPARLPQLGKICVALHSIRSPRHQQAVYRSPLTHSNKSAHSQRSSPAAASPTLESLSVCVLLC